MDCKSSRLLSCAHFAVAICAAILCPMGAQAAKVPPDIAIKPAASSSAPFVGTTNQSLPQAPFSATMAVLNSTKSVGLVGGQLNITSLVLINFDTQPQQVFLFAPIFASGGACGGSIIGGTTPQFTVYVQPSQTLVIPFPTPLVIKGISGGNCFGAEVTTLLHGGSVEVVVTGYYQAGP